MKFQFSTLFLVLLWLPNIDLTAQQVDTIIQNNVAYEYLDFQLANDEWTHLSVSTTDIKIEDGDTVKLQVKLDTVSIRRLKSNDQANEYKFILSDRLWRKALLGKDCNPSWWNRDSLPELHFKLYTKSSDSEFLNCSDYTDLIKKGFTSQLDCIEKSDDQFMKKYVIQWIEKADDCDFQKQTLLQHVGYIIGYLDIIVPKEQTNIHYSISSQEDSSYFMESNYITSKEIDQAYNTKIKITEDLDQGDSNLKNQVKLFYDIFKEQIPKEQQAIDSIRLNSIKEIDTTEISIDSNNVFLKLCRNIESFRLNIELKPIHSKYEYIIEKID